MDLVAISQVVNPVLQAVFIAVIGLGYYFTVRATWATVHEMRAEHAAGGTTPDHGLRGLRQAPEHKPDRPEPIP
jgi:hypothetical protein